MGNAMVGVNRERTHSMRSLALSELESDRNLFLPKYSAEYLTEYSAKTE